MRKFIRFVLLTGAAAIAMCSTALAGTWKEDQTGWYWEEDNGSYASAGWNWLDGDRNGISECYYFDDQGYLLTNQQTPDGNQVDANGCWVVDGVIQTQGGQQQPMDARQQYEAASRKTNDLNSFAARINMDMKMTAQGTNISVNMDMDFKVKDLDSSSVKYLAELRMDMLGQSQTGKMFYTDGYAYMDMGGQKIKVAMPLDEIMETSRNASSGVLQETGFIQDLQVATDGAGNQVFTFTCAPEGFNKLLSQMNQQNMDLAVVTDMKIREYRGTATVNPEGYFIASDLVMVYDATIMGTAVSYDIRAHLDYVNPGQPVDFALPSTAGYTEQ